MMRERVWRCWEEKGRAWLIPTGDMCVAGLSLGLQLAKALGHCSFVNATLQITYIENRRRETTHSCSRFQPPKQTAKKSVRAVP